ncbi:lysis protein [Erwinia sp. V71]|uniref:lysis protein n=1 Tax=Erwinia sp. V71 TaxID=3369424 RepID=UPI003F614EFB
MSRLELVLLIVILLLCGATAYFYDQSGDETRRADRAESGLKLANDTISDMQTRQRDVAALDAKYTGELVDAKATIDGLQRDVADGRKRLQLNATCSTKNNTTGAASVDDAASPRLTDAAQRDYFTLRERISTITSQLTGLQAYVREQCLK